jgi:hypothetical protein
MPMALQTQRNGKVKISEENNYPRKACFFEEEEEEEGQLRERMTVARDRIFHESPQAQHEHERKCD